MSDQEHGETPGGREMARLAQVAAAGVLTVARVQTQRRERAAAAEMRRIATQAQVRQRTDRLEHRARQQHERLAGHAPTPPARQQLAVEA